MLLQWRQTVADEEDRTMESLDSNEEDRNIHDFDQETLQRIDFLYQNKGWDVERLNQKDYAEIFPLEENDDDDDDNDEDENENDEEEDDENDEEEEGVAGEGEGEGEGSTTTTTTTTTTNATAAAAPLQPILSLRKTLAKMVRQAFVRYRKTKDPKTNNENFLWRKMIYGLGKFFY